MLSRNAAPQKKDCLTQFVYVRSKSLTKKKTAKAVFFWQEQ